MNETFEMVAKTFQGLEGVLAEELRGIGASDVVPGKRMVAFKGDLEMLYKANLCCRTALRILKPFYKFRAGDSDSLYEQVKAFDWSTLMSLDKTFSIDTVSFSDEFSHSRFVTYRVKDAIVDWFRDRYGSDKRPQVRLEGADIMVNVHISGDEVTLSLDSSGESLHKRGWRRAQTEAPINEVLAAGIILMSGWRGETPFVDPMCGSGTFLVEAAMIAANINPGIYRKNFAFENWADFDSELFEKLYNDDSNEREVSVPIIGADISPRALDIALENLKGASVSQYVTLETRPISKWEEAPQPAGVMITNPPYGKRISADDMNALYSTIGERLKHVFKGYHAWIIGYYEEYFHEIGLAPSQKVALNNGGLDCELREYVIFEGSKKDFRAAGGRIKDERREDERPKRRGAERKSSFGDRKSDRDRDRDRFRDRDRDRSRNRRKSESGRDEDRERFGGHARKRERDEDRGYGRFNERRKSFRRSDDDERPQHKFDRKDTFKRERREGEDLKQGRGRFRPLDMYGIGREPSIGADKEIVLNRPTWRRRKNREEGED